MAVNTWLDIRTEDAQGYQATLSFRIKPAAFGATTLPTAAKIEALITAIYGAATPSNQKVTSYAVRVEQDTSPITGGSGASPTSEALRARNQVSDANWMFSVPGLDKSMVVFDPSNPNAVSTSGALMDAIRAALVDADIAVSAPTGAYAAVASQYLLQTATVYDGKRAPMRAK